MNTALNKINDDAAVDFQIVFEDVIILAELTNKKMLEDLLEYKIDLIVRARIHDILLWFENRGINVIAYPNPNLNILSRILVFFKILMFKIIRQRRK